MSSDDVKQNDEKNWEDDVNNTELDTVELEPSFDAEAYQSVKNIVARKAVQADELKEKLKEYNESLKNVLVNDAELAEAEDKAKEAKVAVVKRKKSLNDSPEVKNLKLKQAEVKEELKDVEDSLSNQLLQLYQITGVKEFETAAGEVREFNIKAKIKGGAK